MRASRSVEPAGVNGTTTVTVLDGQSCADAEMIAANKTRKGHSSHRGVMGMPPVDLASGDKHAPVKSAAARRPAVAPPSAIGLEVRPSFWLMRATTERTPTTPRRGTGRSRPRWPAPLVEPGAVFAHLLALRRRRVALAG